MENTQVGPFLILKRLGTTRRQHVYRARQIEQDREVALKFIGIPTHIPRESVLEKVDREVKFLQNLKHPNLARLYGAGVEGDKIFFASELVEGESLAAIMSRRGKLAPDLAVEFASQVCLFLEYIHQQELLHAKLTPEKILIDDNGRLKVTDLRINRSRRRRWDAANSRRELDLAAYMSPEQHIEGVTVKSDLYSLGVITYEMLTGKLPYQPDTMGRMTNRKMNEPVPSPAKMVMNCPVWLDKIVTQMLQPEAKARPHSAKAVSMAFDEIKKIDKNKRAAVAQLGGNFSPLTAGADKSEARKLLGKKRKRKKKPEIPFYERVPFLLGCLALIIGIATFALWPTSTEKLFRQGVSLVESDQPKNWNKGRIILRKVIERADPDFIGRAETFITLSQRRTLVNQAEVGRQTGLQGWDVNAFIEAYQFERDGEHRKAIAHYLNLLNQIEEEDKDSYLALEVADRLERLKNLVSLPIAPNELKQFLASLEEVTDEEELREARKKLLAIIERFGKNQQYNDIVGEAKTALEELDVFLAELDKQKADQANEETEAETTQQESDETEDGG